MAIKSAAPKLVPFFKTLGLYFVVFIPHTQPGYLAALLKCLPIISLIVFVIWYSKRNELKDKLFYQRIVTALIFCCLGDYCLIWPSFFELGMICFAIGHIHYILAFGLEPLNLPAGLFVYALTIGGVLYMLPDLHGVLLPGVPIYSFVLSTMVWRACARLKFGKDWSWTRLLTCLGAISFVISDLVIGLDKFKFNIPNDQVIIMSTYYAAQFGLALSVVDNVKSKSS